jgi:hypothetical protein
MSKKHLLHPLKLHDGWIVGPENEHLIWIPAHYRDRLLTPFCKQIISSDPVVMLDLSHFAHGPSWANCYMKSLK